MDNITLSILVGIAGALVGWLVPMAFGGRRPYGLAADVIIGIVVGGGLAAAESMWLIDALGLNMPRWLEITFVFGDPLGGVLVVLWIMRKIKPPAPERD